MKRTPKTQSAEEIDRDTQSTLNRFESDRALRQVGFVIHSRPKNGQPTWTRAGKVYTQKEATILAKEHYKQWTPLLT